jgi:hypothetical protein
MTFPQIKPWLGGVERGLMRLFIVAAACLLLGPAGARAQSRIHYNNQNLFLSGANLAWQYFADDIGPDPATPDTNHFNDVFSQIRANGGNTLRVWLHTTGQYTPAWNGSVVTGPGSNTISDLQTILNLAWSNRVGVVLCLWSFDMLRTNNGSTITSRSSAILTNATYRQTYIANCLTPMVQAVQGHPAIVAWEIINEPEGMSVEYGWNFTVHVPMTNIQAFINQCAGAIHRADPKAKVTSGSWSFYSQTDAVLGCTNYYTDARLFTAGNDVDGKLDFYTVHYYDWMGTALSPFQQPCSYWQLDKPLVVSEFYPPPDCINCGAMPYETLYTNGYAGALTWSWTDSDPADMLAQMAEMYSAHPNDVLILDTEPPAMSLFLAARDTAVVYWPESNGMGWNLEQTTNLSTAAWNAIPPDSLDSDGVNTYWVVSPLTGQQYFRLSLTLP